jgi:putative inorganic carbon (HCO3(-)) transporter
MDQSRAHIGGWRRWLFIALTGIACGLGAAFGDPVIAAMLPLALALLAAAFHRPDYFLVFVASLVPLSIGVNDIGANLGLSLPTEPLIFIALAIFAAKLFLGLRIDTEAMQHPMSLAVLFYLIWIFVTALTSTMPLVSFKNALARTWFIVPFYFIFLHLFRQRRLIHLFLIGFTAATLILILYTLGQHAREGFLRSSSYSIMWPFFPDHGMYAATIAFCVPILAVFAFGGGWFGINLNWRIALTVVLGIVLFGIVVSYTRATWLSLVAAAGVYVLFRLRIPFWSIITVLVCTAGYAVSQEERILYELEQNKQGSDDELEGHVKSVSNISTDPSNLERINRWKCALRMVKVHPITGFGPGTYVFQYGPFQLSSEETIISTHSGTLGDAHSEYFSHLSETGIPGFLIYLSILFIVSQRAFRLVYQPDDRRIALLATGIYLGLLTYLTHALLNNYSGIDKVAVPFWGFCAAIIALDLDWMRRKRRAVQP